MFCFKKASEILVTALSTATSMGNKLLQARCHLLNERILLSENQLEDAKQASEIAQRLYHDADLLCKICGKPMGMSPDQIQVLTCTHFFHERQVSFGLFWIFCEKENLYFLRCVMDILQKWTYQAQVCPKCNKNVLYSQSYIGLSCS